jgi:hypothetical protein
MRIFLLDGLIEVSNCSVKIATAKLDITLSLQAGAYFELSLMARS